MGSVRVFCQGLPIGLIIAILQVTGSLMHLPIGNHRLNCKSFMQAGTPPVYIGFGSMGSGNASHLTELVVQALALSGQRGIVMTGWGALKHEQLPETMFAVDDVPHDWLFPQTAAVVHHGGASSTARVSCPGTDSYYSVHEQSAFLR